MRLYNTLTKKIERFKPITDKFVGMYTCGPTVYFYPHIGNMKAYIDEDLLKRTLIYNNYKVKHVMNITDVGHIRDDQEIGEDKVRSEAKEENKTMKEITDFYSTIFFENLKKLNIIFPDVIERASNAVPEILKLIDILNKKGYLYTLKDGVYFDTSKFKEYGKLMGMTFEELNQHLKAGARVERIEGIKNITDFAVWRFIKSDEKEMVWDSEFGRGFPGWHIECSAISMKHLGEHFDIHCGGIDHIPIHHTNEIAQSESATNKKFVNYWFHVGFLTVNNTKMSKSLKNIYTIEDLEKRGYNPIVFRMFIISGNYREGINFTFEALSNTKNTLEGIYSFLDKLSSIKEKNNGLAKSKEFIKMLIEIKNEFFDHVNNNLDMPNAMAAMHKLIKETNIKISDGSLASEEAEEAINIMLEFDKILGLKFDEHLVKENLSDEIEKLVKEREEARKAKDFEKADKIRKLLKDKYKVILEDTKEGVTWHRGI